MDLGLGLNSQALAWHALGSRFELQLRKTNPNFREGRGQKKKMKIIQCSLGADVRANHTKFPASGGKQMDYSSVA